MSLKNLFLVGIAFMHLACVSGPAVQVSASLRQYPSGAPMAEEIPTRLQKHGDIRMDPYYWMNQRDTPAVLKYLGAERDYEAQVMAPFDGARKKLLEEMQSRMKPNESKYPVKDGNFFYYSRYEAGKEYQIYCRRFKDRSAPEEVYLDANQLYSGDGFFSVTSVAHSPDHATVGYAEDSVGRRIFTLRFKDIKSGKTLNDAIEGVTGNFVWANDGKTIFYTKQDSTTLRWDRVFRHVLGTPPQSDVLIYQEKDRAFQIYLTRSLDRKEIVVLARAKLSSEAWSIPADHPEKKPKLFSKRDATVEYAIHRGGDRYYIYTNWNAENFRVMESALDQTDRASWKEVIPNRKDAYIRGLLVMKDWLVLEVRKNGLLQIELIHRKTLKSHPVNFQDAAYVVSIGENEEYDSPFVRVEYESPKVPETTYDISLESFSLIHRKQASVMGGFKSDNYRVERISVKSEDGSVSIPVTLVQHKKTQRGPKTPLLIYAYGAYGYSADPSFSNADLSLLDRGFVYAIAHVRGGGELGRSWFEGGRTLNRKNTVSDFVSVTKTLQKLDYSSPAHTYALGVSAGGLLMGTLVNEHPELYHGVVAGVPFVDVLTTMLDASIPLTTEEYDIWGNPESKQVYEYIKSYSPYDNVGRHAYPNILVTTGYHDSQVQYWEPAKWIAKLRQHKTDSNLLLFKIDMESGHSGRAGRLNRLARSADWYAFLLMLEGKL
jgi:oligopeptidase B